MKDISVRTTFALLLIVLYVVGSYLDPFFKAHFTNLNIAPLLPLLTIVYLPYLIRRISPHLTTFNLTAKPLLTPENLTLSLRIHYDNWVFVAHNEMIKVLVQNGADVNVIMSNKHERFFKHGKTPLQWAVNKNDLDMVSFLLVVYN